MRPGIAMSALIVIAALVFIGQFDFATRPAGLLYIGAHIATIGAAVALLAYHHAQRRPQTRRKYQGRAPAPPIARFTLVADRAGTAHNFIYGEPQAMK